MAPEARSAMSKVAVACSIGSTTAWLNSQASACTVPPSRRITRDSAITSASCACAQHGDGEMRQR